MVPYLRTLKVIRMKTRARQKLSFLTSKSTKPSTAEKPGTGSASSVSLASSKVLKLTVDLNYDADNVNVKFEGHWTLERVTTAKRAIDTEFRSQRRELERVHNAKQRDR